MTLTRGWSRTISGVGPLLRDFDVDEQPGEWPAIRDQVVAILKQDIAYTSQARPERFEEFVEAVDEMSFADTMEEFNEALMDLYDWADEYRVWIDPTN